MTYLEAVELEHQLEKQYDVMSIRYKGVSVWPFLRLYLLDNIISNRTEIKASTSVIRVVLKSLFAYNPLQIFRRYDIWTFTGCERRKKIGKKMIHRVSGGITACYNNDSLMFEKPDIKKGHYKRKEIEEANIVSESWLLILFHLLLVILKPFKLKLENEKVLKQLLNENGLKFDYCYYVRSLNAKRISMLWIMSLTQKPKLALMECPYDSMGYMWAFRQKGVKVIEMQHGVAGASHNAYNAAEYEQCMNPDGICVYGSEEYNFFTKAEPQYASKVYMTGLYMLEKADEFFNQDIFASYRVKFEKVIVCSGQNGYEEELALFVDEVAQKHNNLLFIYIPRLIDTVLRFNATNVKVAHDVNIYQYVKWSDIHITISSTTCLEAQYFKIPTLFYNYKTRSSNYYGDILHVENGVEYVDKAIDFDSAYSRLTTNYFSYKEVFAHDHVARLKEVINTYL